MGLNQSTPYRQLNNIMLCHPLMLIAQNNFTGK